MRNLSGGNVALSLACQAWLRDDFEHERTPPTNAMKFGNAVHHCIEADIKGQKVDIRAFIDEESLRGPSWPAKVERRYDSWCKWAAKQARTGWSAECAVTFNVKTGESRFLPEGRGYARFKAVDRTCEVPIVVDALDTAVDEHVVVYDWKTGRENPEKDMAQIQACGLGAARLLGSKLAVCRVVYIDDEDVCVREKVIDEFEMIGMASSLEWVFRLEDAEPRPGGHCKTLYCAAQAHCMAYRIRSGE